MAVTSSRAARPHRLQTSTILRHVVINFFMLLIILPLLWVLLLSIKSIPDAYTGHLWPEKFDFTHYSYILSVFTGLRTRYWSVGQVAQAQGAAPSMSHHHKQCTLYINYLFNFTFYIK